MRIGNLAGRLVIVSEGRALDVEIASGGAFAFDPQAIYDRWESFCLWARVADFASAVDFSPDDLGPAVPRPRQIFAIGLNYREHARESGFELPSHPMVFTKFASSRASATTDVHLPSESVDYEVELVVVIGREAHLVAVEDGWLHVAGLTAGQDLSERRVQSRGRHRNSVSRSRFPIFPQLVRSW